MDKPELANFGLTEAEFQKYLSIKAWVTDRLLYGTALVVFIISYAFILTTLLALKWNPVVSLSTSLPSAFVVTVAGTWLPFQILRRTVGRLLRRVWPSYVKGVSYERYCEEYESWCEQNGATPEPYPSDE